MHRYRLKPERRQPYNAREARSSVAGQFVAFAIWLPKMAEAQ